MQDLKAKAGVVIDNYQKELHKLGDEIWQNPELCYEEHSAHRLLTAFLEEKGFSVERAYTGLSTAFRATFGSGKPNVCVICEYDALPGIGHACGHNLIAEAGVAAGLGLKAALESIGEGAGRVTVLGTPAEEGGGGKVALIENGAFEDVDVAMMVHPCPYNIVIQKTASYAGYSATYLGKASHAAAFPWEGINALDAAVMAYNSVSVLRQQMKPTWRVHCVILEGGVKPNIIPERSVVSYFVRAPTSSERNTLAERVKACFEAAATATGCKVELKEVGYAYNDLFPNESLAKLYAKNLEGLGADFSYTGDPTGGSTDMGNVSYAVPSIHPMFKIGSGKEMNHSRDFTAVANTPQAHAQSILYAKAMAHTGIDLLVGEGTLEAVKKAFEQQN